MVSKKIYKHQANPRHGYKDIIRKRLCDIRNKNQYGQIGQDIVDFIIGNLKEILIAPPERLNEYRVEYNHRIKRLKYELKTGGSTKSTKDFNEDILKAFNYKGYRSTLLIWLASKLNIKCCPYCNMHYTLVVQGGRGKSRKMITGFQFDHFFSKSKYPLLSMSLYNLIPACANCNFSKSDNHLPLELHPYHIDLHSKFRFEISDGELNLLLMKQRTDRLRVKLVANDPAENNRIKNFANEFNIEANYSRHKDIVELINEGIYLEKYYYESENFKNLNLDPTILKSQQLQKRLLLGGALDPDEIGRYPLSKFRHDIYHFLKHLEI